MASTSLLRIPCRRMTQMARQKRSRELVDKIIRVDHAGELGADRIYQGQLAVLGNTSVGPVIKEMWEDEKIHLETFNKLIVQHRARPTVLLPIWNIAGFALGSALLGKEGAMACTVAVEAVIGDHYNSQIRDLMEDDPEKHEELLKIGAGSAYPSGSHEITPIFDYKKFRDDELHHHDTGLEHDAEKAPFYQALTQVIKIGCKGAIWISEKI